MKMQDLAGAFQVKTDEELLKLATEFDQLTPEALSVLRCECANRRIDISEHLSSRTDGTTEQQRGSRAPLLSGSGGVAELITEVLGVYHAHFRLFVKLTLPAVVAGFFAVYMARHEVLEIERHLPRGIALREHQTEILVLGLTNFAAYLVSWVAFSCSFAAISSAVSQIESGIVPLVSDSLYAVRERIGPLLRLSLLLFVLLIVAVAIATVILVSILSVIYSRHIRPDYITIQIVSIGLACLVLLVLSRFALAIPAVILGNDKVGQSVFRSDELTTGKWPILAVLLVKSLLGSYLVAMLPFWMTRWMLASVALPSWFNWVLNAASIVGVTVVEPTMFIGFALLYLRTIALSRASEEMLA